MISVITYFEALHIENNIKKRLRHNGKLINIITIDLFDQGGKYDPSSFLEDVKNEVNKGNTIFENAKVYISQDTNEKHTWIELSSEEIEDIYQQAVKKSAPINMNDFGNIITLN